MERPDGMFRLNQPLHRAVSQFVRRPDSIPCVALVDKLAYTCLRCVPRFIMALALSDIANIVSTARFDELIGELEGSFFDAKGQPYRFDEGMDAKREYAKDVASFANADGGYIVIGLATRVAGLSAGDEVAEVRPIASQYFNVDQYRKILEEWLFPQPLGIDIRFIPFGPDPEKGILVVYVPQQNERSKPFLITRTLADKKSTDLLVGFVERRLDYTAARSVVEIHHALRTGFNLERELLGRIENLELLLNRHFSVTQETENAGQASSRLQERILRLIEDAKG